MPRILGIDYGRRRLGVAISDETAMLALPVETVQVENPAEAVAATVRIARDRQAQKIVVGLPLNMNGSRGPMAEEVEAFVKLLAEASGLPVATWDERLSSGLVERVLLDADLSRNRRKQVRDKLAAQVILQGFLDAQAQ